jgi:hypothetical protein
MTNALGVGIVPTSPNPPLPKRLIAENRPAMSCVSSKEISFVGLSPFFTGSDARAMIRFDFVIEEKNKFARLSSR